MSPSDDRLRAAFAELRTHASEARVPSPRGSGGSRWPVVAAVAACVAALAGVGLWAVGGNDSAELTTQPLPPTTSTAPPTTATLLPPVHEQDLPDRYVSYDRSGTVSVVETATGQATELYRTAGFDRFPTLESLAVDPTGTHVYVASDPDRDCVGAIVRIPLDGGEPEKVADGARPVLSPDGQWLVHTIDGYTARGEDPPPGTDPSQPCAHRHDSYMWRDLATGRESRWVAPTPTGDPQALVPQGFDPTSTRLALLTWRTYTAVSIVTAEEPAPDSTLADTDVLEQALDNEGFTGTVRWLPDGTILASSSEPWFNPPPDGVQAYESPDGLVTAPVDVSQPWWLIAGYATDDPADWSGTDSVWAWNRTEPPLLLANHALVAWIPDSASDS